MATKMDVDYEWLYLMVKAKNEGLTVEEIKVFLEQNKKKACT